MRPVFLRIELTLESSFFGSLEGLAGDFVDVVFVGAGFLTGSRTAAGLGSSIDGVGSAVGSGVGIVTGATLRLLG